MTPLPPINIDTLKEDTKENMQPEQMKASHLGAMQLLDDPGSPLYAEPLSMGEYYDTMLMGARHIAYMPLCPCCRSHNALAKVYLDE